MATNGPRVGLDADHHLARLIDLVTDEVRQTSNPLHPFGQAPSYQSFALLLPTKLDGNGPATVGEHRSA
jgi:hypothetical protein